MNLLQLPLTKLQEFIKQQIEENPLLSVESEATSSKSKERFEDLNIIETDSEPQSNLNYNFDDEQKRNYKESLITKPPTLQEHLLRQLRLFTSSEQNRKIGELIIGNIDDNGYLRCSVEDIAESSQVTPLEVEKVLSLIQTFDPIGVGARDLRECLLLQLKARGAGRLWLTKLWISTFLC